jgi:hypothetical protein
LNEKKKKKKKKKKRRMPLIRYELRCEHGLANPELYRAPAAAAAGPAASDDDHSSSSKALLEGVAVAGLVGIVRQLGDLAEYENLFFSSPPSHV